MNGAAAAINLRTHGHSMYITDSSTLNNEMTKVIRIVWRLRDTAGKDRRHIADVMILKRKITSQELQDFAEQEGNINSPWAVIKNDATDLPTFPSALRPNLGTFEKVYFGEIHIARHAILDALAQSAPPAQRAGSGWASPTEAFRLSPTFSPRPSRLIHANVANVLRQAGREFNVALLPMALSISFASFTLVYGILRVINPLRAITDAIQAVASSGLDHPIPFQSRRDEIGRFAGALRSFRDNVIEKRRLEKELRDNRIAKETAEASSRIKSQVLANMRHELRIPLNAIIGFSNPLQNKMFGPLHKQHHDYATIIHESGSHLLNLVSDILNIAKIKTGKFVFNYQPINLSESVAYCVRLIKSRADAHGVKLVTLLPAQGLSFSPISAPSPRSCSTFFPMP